LQSGQFPNLPSGSSEDDGTICKNNPGGLPAVNRMIYCVMDNKRADVVGTNIRFGLHPPGPFYLPAAVLQRRSGVSLSRDRIKQFIWHTCELSDGFFVPKPTVLQRYGLFPHGPLTWHDFYLPPEPNWSELMKYSLQEQIERAQRSVIERDWLQIRRREDLELADLVPLPDLPEFCTRLSSTAIGSALQLLEFFHIFGPALNLLVPKSTDHSRGDNGLLSWDVLERALVDSDPCGPLADLFITLLLAIRRLDTDFSSKRAVMGIHPVIYAAASVVAAAEVGAPFSLSVMSNTCTADWTTLFDDLLLTPGDVSVNTMKLLRDAASAARFNELVAIPYLYLWHGTCRSSRTLHQQLSEAVATTRKEDQSSVTVGPSRTTYTRAVTLAALNGATALCTLDRLGLTSAIRLYMTTAAARGGCWRGPARSCMGPLDDPAFMLCREHGDLLRKLDTGEFCLIGCSLGYLFFVINRFTPVLSSFSYFIFSFIIIIIVQR
ncbi:hypothetical protein FBUS_10637, partial [Fasciolopsis buskii]